NHKEVAVALTAPAIEILKRRFEGRQRAPWVWLSPKNQSGHVEEPRRPWKRVLKDAGIKKHATLHDVRRTLGSNVAAVRASPAIISKVLGHLSSQSAKPYIHLDVEPARAAIEKATAGLVDAT